MHLVGFEDTELNAVQVAGIADAENNARLLRRSIVAERYVSQAQIAYLLMVAGR